MDSNNELIDINIEIENMVHVVRGQKVMLDFELAKFYGYETRYFNRQVQRNIEKFDKTFRFQLTKEEWDEILRCQIVTANSECKNNENSYSENDPICNESTMILEGEKILRSKNSTANLEMRRYIPYAFTEQGIYMLMTVLKGELATRQSITLIKAFKKMKDCILDNQNLITTTEFNELSAIVHDNTRKIAILENNDDLLFKKFNDVSVPKHYLILNGEKVEGDVAYQTIYESACHSLVIVDDYINIKTLQLLKSIKNNVSVTIVSDNRAKDSLNTNFIDDFIKETGNRITMIANNSRFHDRYIMVDLGYKTETLFLCGSSSKDTGNKITTIVKLEDITLYKGIFEQIVLK